MVPGIREELIFLNQKFMSEIIHLFNIILYQPLLNILVLFYKYCHDFGIAILVLTILIKILLSPLTLKTLKAQKALQQLQPKLKEIQRKYKNDLEGQKRAMIELYQKEKINPFSGCFPMLLQLPILIALYQLFRKGLGPDQFSLLYNFILPPENISLTFLGIINLAQPSLFLAVLAGIVQFIQTRSSLAGQDNFQKDPKSLKTSQLMQKQLSYFFPIFTVLILLRLPAAVALYWLTVSAISIIQQKLYV